MSDDWFLRLSAFAILYFQNAGSYSLNSSVIHAIQNLSMPIDFILTI